VTLLSRIAIEVERPTLGGDWLPWSQHPGA